MSTLALVLFACKVKPELVIDRLPDRIDVRADETPITTEEMAELVDNFARVYFDSDTTSVSPDGRAALAANAAILARHPGVRVQIEGHADERGTVDYNLALGQRRAAEVVRWLTVSGVPGSRLSVVSLGEERPADPGSGTVAWAANRRAEFRVLTGTGASGTVQ